MNVMRGLPVLAVCGWSGSGKTTLLEALIPRLRQSGFRVAVIKSDAHGVEVDRPGKDSDRLFRAGADVMLGSQTESFARWHREGAPGLLESLRNLALRNDVVLVEGHKGTEIEKLWLLSEGETGPPDGVEGVVGVLPWNGERIEAALDAVLRRLDGAHHSRLVMGGVLIGGQSRRMGAAKQLLEHRGRTIVETVAAALEAQVDEVVLLGTGELPPSLAGHRVLADPPGVEGPLAGIASGLRWAPHATWLMASCDLPLLTSEGARWLLAQRRPGRWAILPRTASGKVDPLFAVYEPQALPLVERLIAGGTPAPRRLAESDKVESPMPPEVLARQWKGVNTPEEYDEICDEPEDPPGS